MQTVRQLGSGLFYALVSVVLVVGGLSLALSEHGIELPPTASPTMTLSGTWMATGLGPTETAVASLTETPPISTTATPLVSTTATPAIATPYPDLLFPPFYVAPPATPLYFACGPFAGWIKNYFVRPGDTLIRIAILYRTTVERLERANCKPWGTIFPGERLWVPNIRTITPGGLTIIPTFSTPTDVPTQPLTYTASPYTAMVIPTDTSGPAP